MVCSACHLTDREIFSARHVSQVAWVVCQHKTHVGYLYQSLLCNHCEEDYVRFVARWLNSGWEHSRIVWTLMEMDCLPLAAAFHLLAKAREYVKKEGGE